MPIEALEGVSDQDLFDQANADEAPADEAVAEAPEAAAEQEPEQPRDEQGRFAAQVAETPEAPVAANPAPAPAVDDNAAMVPSWRVREIREERDATQKRLEALEAERLNWQRQQPAAPPAKEPEKVAKPDPLIDPEGYEAYLEAKVESRILNDRREESLHRAHKTYGPEFEEAYAAAQKQVDQVLRIKMQTARDPGETLIEWHREQKTRAEVGNDLNAFRQREQDRLLSDPAFLAKAVEKARGIAQPQPQPGQPRQAAPVNLPPSLTRVANAAATQTADDDDVSDDGLWRHANA